MNNLYIQIYAIILTTLCAVVFIQCNNEKYVIHHFDEIQLSSKFYAEGAGIGDLNGNGYADVICGPYWYEGPDFTQGNAFYEPVVFDTLGYSDNFIVEVRDLNGNGRQDILVVGFPGEEAYWYENPGSVQGYWTRHLIHPNIDNESPIFTDLYGNGKLDLVFHTEGYLGYASPDPNDPTAPWIFTSVSGQNDWGRFTHGLGVGDVNGNGHKDIMMARGWWENPGPDAKGQLWTHHSVDFYPGGPRPGGAQMYAWDVDGDGYNDVITTLQGHGWGLAWYRQVRENGEISFEKQLIMGESVEDNPYGIRFSAPHALELADLNNNGLKDLITGKRLGTGSDPDKEAPAVIYWFKLVRLADGGAGYIPYLIDDDSGIGTQFTTRDLTGNGYRDIVTCNKKGGHIFLNRPERVSRDVWQSAQPQKLY